MIKHYMTKYLDEDDNVHYESWIQLNILRWAFTLSKREYINGKRVGK